MILSEGVAVADVGILHSVELHVHAADAEHGVVKIEPVEHPLVEVLPERGIAQDLGVVVAEILPGGHEEAAGTARGVADDILARGGGQLDHELDDVAGCPELTIPAGRGDLPEHVLVEISLGIAVLHGDVVNHVDDLGQQGGLWDGEPGILHVMRVGGVLSAEVAEEGENMLSDHLEHFCRGEVPEP